MRRVMLLRHAKTEKTSATGQDIDRRLDERGRAEAPEMGIYMWRNNLVPDVALVSPATRTRESALLVTAQFAPEPAMIQIADLYAASAQELLRIVHEDAPSQAKSLVIIGHNPGLHEFALTLAAQGDPKAAALSDNFPTAGLVVLDFAVDSWAGIAPHAGRIERFVSPRLLREEAD